MSVCLYQRILLTSEPILFFYTRKLPICPEMGLGYFIFIPYINPLTHLNRPYIISVPIRARGLKKFVQVPCLIMNFRP